MNQEIPSDDHEATLLSDIVQGLYSVRGQDSRNELWDEITPEEAVIVRAAVGRAIQLRAVRADPGDAYLEATGVMLALSRRLRLATETQADITVLPTEIPRPRPAT